MEVLLDNLSRSFGRQKVIDKLDYRFADGESYAILGGNGSGKSTLLKLVFGSLTPSGGSVTHLEGGQKLKPEEVPFKINLAGPYLELIEELTAREFLIFYEKFRSLKSGIRPDDFLELTMLQDSSDKEIRNFSSGMKQRLRLGIALLSQSSMVLLDEPTSNLDPKGAEWYRTLVKDHLDGRTLLIGSNFDEREMDFCKHQLPITR